MEEHKHYWWAENKQHHPDYEVIIRMIDPEFLFADFDEFADSVAG